MTWFLLWQQTGCLQASRKRRLSVERSSRQAPKILIAEPHMHNCRTAYAQIFKFFCSYSPFGGSPGKAACPKCVAYEAKLFRLSGDGHVSDKPPLILGATRLGILSAIVPRWERGGISDINCSYHSESMVPVSRPQFPRETGTTCTWRLRTTCERLSASSTLHPAPHFAAVNYAPKTACAEAIAPLHGENVFGNVRAVRNRDAAQRRP